MSYDENGISLRDYFAAKALPAILALSDGKYSLDWVSRHAYRVADAMLEAKENSNGNN